MMALILLLVDMIQFKSFAKKVANNHTSGF